MVYYKMWDPSVTFILQHPIQHAFYVLLWGPCPLRPYITENFIDNNRTLFRHSCALPRITLGFMKQCTHLDTHACIPSLSLGPHNTYTCRQFIISSLSLMLYYHLLLHNIIYDITLYLCSWAVFHMFHHMSLFLVTCNSLKSWSK